MNYISSKGIYALNLTFHAERCSNHHSAPNYTFIEIVFLFFSVPGNQSFIKVKGIDNRGLFTCCFKRIPSCIHFHDVILGGICHIQSLHRLKLFSHFTF